MSTRALYQIEKDKGNPTLYTIDAILRKFGMRMGLTSAAKNTPSPTLGRPNLQAKHPGVVRTRIVNTRGRLLEPVRPKPNGVTVSRGTKD
jgi:DNA-binding XRE family transcriptional regulator